MLPKQQRLKKSSAFTATYRLKKSLADALLVLYTGKPKKENYPTRVGFVVSKKIHKSAVKRNRIKRLVREAYRHALEKGDIKEPKFMSLIFMGRDRALETDYQQVYDSVVRLVNKAGKKF